jgi:hypothetical protein
VSRSIRLAILSALPLAVLLAGAGPTEIPDAPVTYIGVDELKRLADRGSTVEIVDVRRSEAFVQQHIKGARSVPLQTFPEGASTIPRRGLVVLY